MNQKLYRPQKLDYILTIGGQYIIAKLSYEFMKELLMPTYLVSETNYGVIYYSYEVLKSEIEIYKALR